MKQYLAGGVAAALIGAGLVAAAAPASAGCMHADWPGHPFARMCDSPVTDGMWERCVTWFPNGPRNIGETDCFLMSAGNPPAGDPALGNPPTHIDP